MGRREQPRAAYTRGRPRAHRPSCRRRIALAAALAVTIAAAWAVRGLQLGLGGLGRWLGGVRGASPFTGGDGAAAALHSSQRRYEGGGSVKAARPVDPAPAAAGAPPPVPVSVPVSGLPGGPWVRVPRVARARCGAASAALPPQAYPFVVLK